MKHKSERSKMCALLLATAFWFAPVSHASDVILEDDHTIHLLTDEEVEGLVESTRKRGYTCDSVSSAYYRTEKNILLECNDRYYAYAIIDHGGKRLVFVDSILHNREPEYCYLCRKARDGDVDSVRRTAESKWYLLQIDKHGMTPLTHAVIKGNVEIVRILLDAGAIASKVNKRGYTTKEGSYMYSDNPEINDMLSEATKQYKAKLKGN